MREEEDYDRYLRFTESLTASPSKRNAISCFENHPLSFWILVSNSIRSSLASKPSPFLFIHNSMQQNSVSWCMNLLSDSIVLYVFLFIPRYSAQNLKRLSAEMMSVTLDISADDSWLLHCAISTFWRGYVHLRESNIRLLKLYLKLKQQWLIISKKYHYCLFFWI